MIPQPAKAPLPVYEQIKQAIRERIDSGEWSAGMRVPSENELIKQLSVSRMTVNRALRELAGEGLLERVQGVGTFVAEPTVRSDLLELRNIADEIRERGGHHAAELLRLEELHATAEQARQLHLIEGAKIFRSVILHREDGKALQLEDRLVVGAQVPDYGKQDFARMTPNAYLSEVAPAEEVEHRIEAILPSQEIAAHLAMKPGEPCLLLRRRTWAKERVVSAAHLYHPGGRYSFGTHFRLPRNLNGASLNGTSLNGASGEKKF